MLILNGKASGLVLEHGGMQNDLIVRGTPIALEDSEIIL